MKSCELKELWQFVFNCWCDNEFWKKFWPLEDTVMGLQEEMFSSKSLPYLCLFSSSTYQSTRANTCCWLWFPIFNVCWTRNALCPVLFQYKGWLSPAHQSMMQLFLQTSVTYIPDWNQIFPHQWQCSQIAAHAVFARQSRIVMASPRIDLSPENNEDSSSASKVLTFVKRER